MKQRSPNRVDVPKRGDFPRAMIKHGESKEVVRVTLECVGGRSDTPSSTERIDGSDCVVELVRVGG